MAEKLAKTIKIGDEFTPDRGRSWHLAVKVESRQRGSHVWIESVILKNHSISSEIYEANLTFIVR